MAVITVTAANVRPATNRARPATYTCSEAITAGQAVHYDATLETVRKANTTDYTNCVGIALSNTTTAGDLVLVQTSGAYDIGGTALEGQMYYLNGTAGSLGLFSDIGSEGVIQVMYATSATTGVIAIKDTTVTL